MWWQNQDDWGFTLLELIITTSLGLILLAGALASYSTYANQQQLAGSSRAVVAVLRQAQSRSRDGDKPDTNCNQLNFYRVRAQENTQTYYLSIQCDGNNEDLEEVPYTLTNNYFFLSSFDIRFPPLPGPVTGAPTTVQIGELDDAEHYELTVSAQGVVEETGRVSNQ